MSKTAMCPLVYTGIATSPMGTVRPCCVFEHAHAFNGSVSEYRTSELWNDIEKSFLNGEFHPGCSHCELQEKAGADNKMRREIKNFKSKYNKEPTVKNLKEVGYDYIDLRLSNTCNLGCLSCNPNSSSFIRREIEANTDYHAHGLHVYENSLKYLDKLNNPYSDKEIDSLFKSINESSRIYFTGGEPSIIKSVLEILERLIASGLNKTVSIEFNSNFQTSNPKFIELLGHFPNGVMMPSLDAVGDKAYYIRYPSNWNQILKNMKLFKETCPTWKFNFTPTVSILNLFYLDELQELADDIGASIILQNTLSRPNYFSIRNLTDEYKQRAIEQLEKTSLSFGTVKNFMMGGDTNIDQLLHCRNSLEKIDKIRNISYKTYLPILEEIFNDADNRK